MTFWAASTISLKTSCHPDRTAIPAPPPTLTYFVFGVPEFIAGVLCFFLADWIVKLAYRDAAS